MLFLETVAVAAKTRLVAAGLCGGNVDLHRDPPTTDALLPIASVTYAHDVGKADGDPRTGTQDFVHTMTLLVDVYDTAVTGAGVMTKLAQHGEKVMQALVADVGWGVFDGGASGIEGIDGVRQVREKAIEGERIVYHLQVQVDLLYRSQWEPDASGLEDFTTLGVDTGLGADDAGAGSIGAVIPVPTE